MREQMIEALKKREVKKGQTCSVTNNSNVCSGAVPEAEDI